MLVFAMCHYNYISSWEVSFCCGCRQQGPPARVVFFYSGKKIAIFKCKNVFSIGYVKQLAIWMHPSNACLLSLTKTKRQTLLKPGHCLGDPFYCARARSNDPASMEKDIIRLSMSTTKRVAQVMSQL